jgi:conjugative transposon TraJ protein
MDFNNLHQILRNLYTDMMPLCSNMIGVAKGIAGLGALFYVAHRVWQALSRAEPIDVYPLLRPFAIGLCIMFFPSMVLGTINAVMSPVVTGTHSILESQTFDMNRYRAEKDRLEYEAIRRNPETAWLVDNAAFDQRLEELGVLDAPEIAGMYIERGFYNFKKTVQDFFRNLLELLFQAAALVIDTIRTFLSCGVSHIGAYCFCDKRVRWFPEYTHPMDNAVYLGLPVVAGFRSVFLHIGADTGIDAHQRHRTVE